MKTVEAFDLHISGSPGATVAAPRPQAKTRAWSYSPTVPPAARASLSLLVPGSGQFARGEIAHGLFFLSGVGFMATLAWALLGTFDRLAPTLALLGYPAQAGLWAIGVAYLITAGLHISGVWLAAMPDDDDGSPALHPSIPAVASAVVPGWGQLLNGDRVRAAVFLAAVWVVGGMWISGSESAATFLSEFMPTVGGWEQTMRSPFAVWTAQITVPVLVWSVAIYDAASSAVSNRR